MFKTYLTVTLGLLLLGASPLQAAEASADPMQPPKGTSSPTVGKKSVRSTQGYYLSSIRIAKNHRLAMINGKLVAPGQRIGNARVIDIMANHVTIQVAGKRKNLSLLPIRIKKPVEAIQ